MSAIEIIEAFVYGLSELLRELWSVFEFVWTLLWPVIILYLLSLLPFFTKKACVARLGRVCRVLFVVIWTIAAAVVFVCGYLEDDISGLQFLLAFPLPISILFAPTILRLGKRLFARACEQAPSQSSAHSSNATHPPSIYAGFLKRLAALVVDVVVLSIPSVLIGRLFGNAFGARIGEESTSTLGSVLMAHAVGLAMSWVYFAAMESSPFQGTIGKLALGIKVTDMAGNRITFERATGRFVGRIISAIIFGLGFIMVAFTAKKQGLHDMMAGCLVVNK